MAIMFRVNLSGTEYILDEAQLDAITHVIASAPRMENLWNSAISAYQPTLVEGGQVKLSVEVVERSYIEALRASAKLGKGA